MSTANGILNADGGLSKEHDHDYESLNRFYHSRDISKTQPHKFTFVVVRKSMQTRYFLEIVFFLTLTVYFQYKLIALTHAWNTAIGELNILNASLIEIQAKFANGLMTRP